MISELLGRFHPLVVHLPIGILIVAYLMELFSRSEKFEKIKVAIPFVLQLGILFSLIALLTGWIMPKEGEFDERLIGLHLWFSVAMTISSILVYAALVYKDGALKKMYFPLFTLCMILLMISGHFGGSLTHGEGHLIKPLGENNRTLVSDVNSLEAYNGIIQPILKKKCYGCHNEEKKKGGLIMSNKEDFLEGGENGVIILAGNPDESTMIQKVHLPLEDDDHMPPKGKKQLTKNEIKLLEWWIAKGASFDQLIGEIAQTEEVSNILKGYEQTYAVIDTSKLSKPSDEDLNDLRALGFTVYPINEHSPLINVSYSRDTLLSTRKLNKLKKYKENIIALDLSNSNVNDGMLSGLKKFENLQELRLQNTGITSESIEYISQLKILEYLNLYNTKVDNQSLSNINQMASLKSLYLWQSEVTPDAVNEFIESHPLVNVEFQIDSTIFGDAQLKPPLIAIAKDMFEDTISVSLNLNFKNVKLYYTIDGTAPDSTSTLYVDPFIIDKTCNIKAISFKDGWTTSEVVERMAIKVGHLIADIKLQSPPNKKYKAKGAKSLIDLEKGSTNFVEGKWLGYQAEHLTCVLDLGSKKSVSNVLVSALEDTRSYIFFPKRIQVQTSVDGTNYTSKEEISIPIAEEPSPALLKTFLVSFPEREIQYIKVKIMGTLRNPKWHAAPGANNWIFVDEVMVN